MSCIWFLLQDTAQTSVVLDLLMQNVMHKLFPKKVFLYSDNVCSILLMVFSHLGTLIVHFFFEYYSQFRRVLHGYPKFLNIQSDIPRLRTESSPTTIGQHSANHMQLVSPVWEILLVIVEGKMYESEWCRAEQKSLSQKIWKVSIYKVTHYGTLNVVGVFRNSVLSMHTLQNII